MLDEEIKKKEEYLKALNIVIENQEQRAFGKLPPIKKGLRERVEEHITSGINGDNVG